MDGGILLEARPRAWLDEVAENAVVHDRDASFPFDSLDLLHQDWALALTARAEDGGGAAGLRDSAALVGDVGRACPSTALVLAMQLIHVKMSATAPGWPERLRSAVGRGAGRYGALVNALRVEPALGTPARGGLPETVARSTPDGWSLAGRKIYSTGAPGLTWMLVFARTDEAEPRAGLFLVPARDPGVRIEETWDHLGLRASGSHDVILRDVAVPRDHAVDLRAPAGWRVADPVQGPWNVVLIAALYTGVARAARDWVVGFLRDRAPSNLGAPLATLPRMQEAVGGIDALLAVNARLVDGLAADWDRGAAVPATELGLLKSVACENAIAAVQQAVRLAGNHGLSRANPLERHLRDVLCARIHTPQQDAAHAAAGRLALLPEQGA